MVEFRYIVRIASVDIDGSKDVARALTGIRGIGNRMATTIVDRAGIARSEQIGSLEDEQIAKLEEMLQSMVDWAPKWMLNRRRDMETGNDLHIYGLELSAIEKDDVNYLRKIRAYRGIRHETGQKTRGQRTRTNGRTGLTVGVIKKRS